LIKSDFITNTQKEIIKTLLYFDVFNYPLTAEEIWLNTCSKVPDKEFMHEISELINSNHIHKKGDFYSVSDNISLFIERRLTGNAMAKEMLPKAINISKRIAKFPFVSGVCISGGLSKNYFDSKSDFDFFIITKSNRLWICRTIYIVLYKTFSKEKKKLYCLNYFISESDLVINDRNLFVAKELAYLIPTINYKAYINLLNSNLWYKTYFTNMSLQKDAIDSQTREPWYKIILESLFFGRFGNWVDSLFLNVTLNRWRKKYPEMNNDDFDLQFRSRKHVCKRHTHGYQNKVLQMYIEKVKAYESKFYIKLS
jgi:hypothetical protein